MKTQLIIVLLLLSSFGNAQSDIIEYRSHSGNMKSFNKYSTKAVDGVETNFGRAPNRMVKNAVLDTVRLISECEVVMVTSEHCKNLNYPQAQPTTIRDQREYDLRRLYGETWSAGRDTIVNHLLFVMSHSLDSIKQVLTGMYNFQNPIETVVFVGYDNLEMEIDKEKPTEETQPIDTKNQDKGGFGMGILLAVLLPILVLYIFSPLAYKWAKNDF